MSKMPINKGLMNLQAIKNYLVLVVFALFSSLQMPVFASNHDENNAKHGVEDGTKEKFKPGKMIMEHIKNSYDWHIMDINHHPISIPLPIITYHSQDGMVAFLSSKLEHGHADHKGYKLVYNDSESRYRLVRVDGTEFTDLSMTKNAFALIFASVLLLVIMLSVAKGYNKRKGKAPKGIQSFMEPLILFIRDEVAKPSIGKSYEKFLPFLLTIFFFIFINNLLGLVPLFPGGANVTGNIAVTLVLAVFTFLITTFSGKKDYWKHIFLPDVPVWMYVLMIPIEILGMILKPFVLMLRLFANITAGHIIILGFFSLIFIFGEMSQGVGMGVGVFSVVFTVFMSVLELLVAFLQAYVFTLLSALYFGMAVEEHHHAEEHH